MNNNMDKNSTRRSKHFYTMLLSLLLVVCNLQEGMLQTSETLQDDDDFQLDIISDPLGPIYPAGSWLRLACRVANLSEDFTYQWIGKCNATDNVQLVVDQPILDEEYFAEFWLFSSPSECLDLAVCNVIDLNTFEVVANASVFIGHVTGVGLSIEHQFNPGLVLDNASIILTPSDCLAMDTPTILCHSSTKSVTNDIMTYWLDPNGNIMSLNTTSNSVEAFTAVGLTLCEEGPEDSLSEGIYACIGVDENEQTQTTYLGVYLDKNHEIQTDMDFHFNGDSLHLEFTTKGLPTTTTRWNKNKDLIKTDNTMFSVDQTLLNTSSATYTSELVIYDFAQQVREAESGSLSFHCDVYMDIFDVDLFGLVDTDQIFVSGQFILTTLGEQAIIECAFSKVVSNVEWLGPSIEDSQIFRSSSGNGISMSLRIGAEHHRQRLMCRGVDVSGEFVHTPFLIIVHIPLAIEVTSSSEDSQLPIVGFTHSLRCCASIGNITRGDVFDGLLLEWIRHVDNGPVVTIETKNIGSSTQRSRHRNHPCIKMTFEPLHESDEGTYECRSTLMASQQQVMRSVRYDLQVVPRNDIIETSSSGSIPSQQPTKETSHHTTSFSPRNSESVTAADSESSGDNNVFLLSVTLASSFSFVVILVIVVLIMGLGVNLWVLRNRRNQIVGMKKKKNDERDSQSTSTASSEEKPSIISTTTTMSDGTSQLPV